MKSKILKYEVTAYLVIEDEEGHIIQEVISKPFTVYRNQDVRNLSKQIEDITLQAVMDERLGKN